MIRASLSLLAVAWVGLFIATLGCASAGGSPGAASAAAPAGDHGITLYVGDGADMAAWFRSHRVLVSAVGEGIEAVPGGTRVALDYPSPNERNGPMYSHRVVVRVPDGVPLSIAEIAGSRKLAVLLETTDREVYDLIGVVEPGAPPPPFDFFEDKPGYRYRE